MAVDYSKIKNQKIAELLKELPYLEILPDEEKQKYVDRIAKLPKEGEKELIALFKNQIETLPKLTDEEKITIYEAQTDALSQLMKNFKKETLEEGEKISEKEEEIQQKKLLEELDNL